MKRGKSDGLKKNAREKKRRLNQRKMGELVIKRREGLWGTHGQKSQRKIRQKVKLWM